MDQGDALDDLATVVYAINMTRATVREIDGRLVLDDPDAVSVIRAVEKHNCRLTLDLNTERVEHFKRRIAERGDRPEDVVVVVINVDDVHGRPIAELLMPGQDALWSDFRAKGMIPFARCLAGRLGIQEALAAFDPEAAKKLEEWTGVAVVVIDHGVAEIY